MNEPILPNDPTQWPSNPRDILGVPSDVSPQDLKRAYTRLIRRYKPEQFPEQFRLIREAYETLKSMAEFMARLAKNREPEEGAAEPDFTATKPDVNLHDVDRPPAPSAPLPATNSEVNADAQTHEALAWPLQPASADPWQLLMDGQHESAYCHLVLEQQTYPGRPSVYWRLYWALKLFPDLDPVADARDWLTRGILATTFTGPLWELYRRELELDPAEVLTDRCRTLLLGLVHPDHLNALVEARWQAAYQVNSWKIIRADLDVLRGLIRLEDEKAWVRLLYKAIDRLAWFDEPEANGDLGACFREIEESGHLAISMPYEFDRVEYMEEVASGWRQLQKDRDMPPQLLALLAESWHRSFLEMASRFIEVLGEISEAPSDWLAHLDEVERYLPSGLIHFQNLLDQFQQYFEIAAGEEASNDLVGKIVFDFLDSQGLVSYAQYRDRFMKFCLYEMISPEHVAEICGDRMADWTKLGVSLAQALINDKPLQVVYRSCRLYWAR